MPEQDALRSNNNDLRRSIAVDWAGQTWRLLADRAVYWPAAATLIVADLHLGKPAAFRAAGIPVPELTTRADLARLAALIDETAAARVLFLGDLLHAPTGRAPETFAAFADFRASPIGSGVDMLLVRGNHDTRAGDPPSEWNIRCVDEPLNPVHLQASAHGFELRHHPPMHTQDAAPIPAMIGHIHPGITLSGPARSRLRCRCFHVTPSRMTLPAFGSFTGLAPISPIRGDRVFALCDNEIIEVSSY